MQGTCTQLTSCTRLLCRAVPPSSTTTQAPDTQLQHLAKTYVQAGMTGNSPISNFQQRNSHRKSSACKAGTPGVQKRAMRCRVARLKLVHERVDLAQAGRVGVHGPGAEGEQRLGADDAGLRAAQLAHQLAETWVACSRQCWRAGQRTAQPSTPVCETGCSDAASRLDGPATPRAWGV